MTAVKAYIAGCPQEHQDKLTALRGLILAARPDLKEKLAWGMPTFHLNKNVIHFALHKAHIGIYPGAAAIAAFSERLTPYKFSKGAFQLPLTQPLPEQLMADLTRWCAEQASL